MDRNKMRNQKYYIRHKRQRKFWERIESMSLKQLRKYNHKMRLLYFKFYRRMVGNNIERYRRVERRLEYLNRLIMKILSEKEKQAGAVRLNKFNYWGQLS